MSEKPNVIGEWIQDSSGSLWVFSAKAEIMEYVDDTALSYMAENFHSYGCGQFSDTEWGTRDPRAFLEELVGYYLTDDTSTDILVLKYFRACRSHFVRIDKFLSNRFTHKIEIEEIFATEQVIESSFPPPKSGEVFQKVEAPIVQQVLPVPKRIDYDPDDYVEQSPGMVLKRICSDWTWVSDVEPCDSVRMHVESYRAYGLVGSARRKAQQGNRPKIKVVYRQRKPMARAQKTIIGWTPRRVIRTLLWRDPTYIRNNAAVAYATWRYTPNNLNNIDPALASTIDGRTVLFSQYNTFRVLRISASIDFVNLEAFAVVVGGFPQGIPNSDPGLNSNTIQQSFDMQPFKRSKLLGSVNGDNIYTMNFPEMSVVKWTGFPAARIDDNFAGIGNATPNTLIYMPMAIRASGGPVTLLNGVNVDAKFKLTCEFSEMVALAV